jgi:hypothetical protein
LNYFSPFTNVASFSSFTAKNSGQQKKTDLVENLGVWHIVPGKRKKKKK